MTPSASNKTGVTPAQEGQPPGTEDDATPATALPDVAEAVSHLDRLIPRLKPRGMVAFVRRPPDRPPLLHVRRDSDPNVSGDVIADDTCARLHVSGDVHPADTWSYWWTWGERIAPATDPDKAARRIDAALTPIGGPDHAA